MQGNTLDGLQEQLYCSATFKNERCSEMIRIFRPKSQHATGRKSEFTDPKSELTARAEPQNHETESPQKKGPRMGFSALLQKTPLEAFLNPPKKKIRLVKMQDGNTSPQMDSRGLYCRTPKNWSRQPHLLLKWFGCQAQKSGLTKAPQGLLGFWETSHPKSESLAHRAESQRFLRFAIVIAQKSGPRNGLSRDSPENPFLTAIIMLALRFKKMRWKDRKRSAISGCENLKPPNCTSFCGISGEW